MNHHLLSIHDFAPALTRGSLHPSSRVKGNRQHPPSAQSPKSPCYFNAAGERSKPENSFSLAPWPCPSSLRPHGLHRFAILSRQVGTVSVGFTGRNVALVVLAVAPSMSRHPRQSRCDATWLRGPGGCARASGRRLRQGASSLNVREKPNSTPSIMVLQEPRGQMGKSEIRNNKMQRGKPKSSPEDGEIRNPKSETKKRPHRRPLSREGRGELVISRPPSARPWPGQSGGCAHGMSIFGYSCARHSCSSEAIWPTRLR